MKKRLNQKLKIYNNETIVKNNNKSNNTIVEASYYVNQNAITLIALVITIIVLLILAGVTINLVLGPEGLLKQAQDATDRYKQAENEEVNSMSNLLAQLEEINNGNGGGTPSEPENPPTPIDPETAEAGDIIRIENNIKYTSDGEGNQIPVPVGFSYAGEGTKETGFVIRNDEDLNEFTWVPVEGMPYDYDRYVFLSDQTSDGIDEATNSKKIRYTSAYCTEAMPLDEQTSVNTYGGYYIARYEAGILEQRTTKGDATTPPILKKSTNEQIVYVYNYITIDQAKSLAEGLYNKTENNITSKLCSSYAWDTALKFIETKNEGWASRSQGGNFGSDSAGTRSLEPTGYHSVNNIYDMGGNAWDLTSELCSWDKNGVGRGGSVVNSKVNKITVNRPGFRNPISIDNLGNAIYGFRVTLYL